MKQILWTLMAGAMAACLAAPARAQLVLPGAAPPTPAGATPPAAGGKKSAKAAGTGGPESGGAAITKAPGEETVAGRQFQRNGSTGVLALERPGKDLELGKLVLVGYQISKPAELCRVDISGQKISLKPDKRFEGLLSWQVELEACPFSIDILDGAIRARGRVCEFKAADCTVDPSGVWGPPGATIGPEEAKNIEKLRGKADKDARAGFRAVLAKYSHDKVLSRDLVRDQASFSSRREELCRDYAREDKHGFCSSRITLARAVYLSSQLRGEGMETADAKGGKPPPKKKKPRPKPVAGPAATTGLPGPAIQ